MPFIKCVCVHVCVFIKTITSSGCVDAQCRSFKGKFFHSFWSLLRWFRFFYFYLNYYFSFASMLERSRNKKWEKRFIKQMGSTPHWSLSIHNDRQTKWCDGPNSCMLIHSYGPVNVLEIDRYFSWRNGMRWNCAAILRSNCSRYHLEWRRTKPNAKKKWKNKYPPKW